MNPQHAHWPLVVMLVLTQLSVGAFCAGLVLERLVCRIARAPRCDPLHAASGARRSACWRSPRALFHLGRPQFAFRAVLGLRHSWLSREIVAFGVVRRAGVRLCWRRISQFGHDRCSRRHRWVDAGSAGASPRPACVAVFCSAMIYVFTQRECWSFARVGVRFALTGALLGRRGRCG